MRWASWLRRLMAGSGRRGTVLRSRPSFDPLEDRVTPALTAGLNGAVLTFNSPGSSNDALVLSTDSNGNLRHNLFSQGVAGFASNIDLDSTTPGVQSRTLSQLFEIEVNTRGGSDAVKVNGLTGATINLEIHLANVEEVTINLTGADDVATLSSHDGHLDVTAGAFNFHVENGRELVLDGQGGDDQVVAQALGGAQVPADIDLVAEDVTIETGDGGNDVRVGLVTEAGPHKRHLAVEYGQVSLHAVRTDDLAIDTQGGADSITVQNLATAANLPEDIDLIAEKVKIMTGGGDNNVSVGVIAEPGPHQGHLAVEYADASLHAVGADELIINSSSGRDRVTVEDLSGGIVPGDIDVVNAERVDFHTGSAADSVELAVHQGHLDVEYGVAEFHVEGSRTVSVDGQGGEDSVLVRNLNQLSLPPSVHLDNIEQVTFNGTNSDDLATLRAHDGHLDVELGRRDFHIAGAQVVTYNALGGNDRLVVRNLNGIIPPQLVLQGNVGADRYEIATSRGDIRVEDVAGNDTLDLGFYGPVVDLDLSLNEGQPQSLGENVTLALVGDIERVVGADING